MPPYLLDVTRLVANAWAGKPPTGIDRVCFAYLSHFAGRALAVIQHRGLFRVLTEQQTEQLADLLDNRAASFRCKFSQLAAALLVRHALTTDYAGKIYLNAGHTDFDLPAHWQWVRENRLKTFYFIHDLIPIRRPDLTREPASRRHYRRVLSALNEAHGIIVNSKATLEDIRNFAFEKQINNPPSLVAHLGTDHLIKSKIKKINPTKYFLCVSTIEPRKNHLFLIDLWKYLIKNMGSKAPNLVLIGQLGFRGDQVRNMLHKDAALANHITLLETCSDAEMAEWIESAQALLLPSVAEGYGLPMAEAMALGVPVIASDLPCSREIGKGIPLFLPASAAAEWEAAIIDFISRTDEPHRQRKLLEAHNPKTWSAHFERVETWIGGCLADQCRHRFSAESELEDPRFKRTALAGSLV